MIPIVLSVPADPRRPPGARQRLVRWAGILLLLMGVAGTVVWVLGYSPVSFERFRADAGAHSVALDGPGTYVVLEERTGDTPPALPVIVVQGPTGQRIVAGLPAGDSPAPVARSLPFFRAWELGRFEVPDDGTYSIYAVRPTPADPRPAGILAVAGDRSLTWLGGWAGLAALGFAPAMAGVVVLGAVARRTRRSGTGGHETIR